MNRLNYDNLNLNRFLPGACIRYHNAFHIISDPFRAPFLAVSGLFAPVGSVVDKLRVALLRSKLLDTPLARIFESVPQPLDSFLRSEGFSQQFIDAFFRPFYQGIFLAPLSEQSSTMFSFVFKMFSAEPASLPAGGIGEIPRQMFASLPSSVDVKLNCRVKSVDGTSVTTENQLYTPTVTIVAAEGPEAARLLTGVTTPASRGSICLYFTSNRPPPITKPILILNGEKNGPVNNMFFPAQVAGTYAPAGKTLISTTIVGDELGKSDKELENAVREQLRGWYDEFVDEWKLLRVYRIPHSQPAQAEDFVFDKGVKVQDGLYVCGDHRNSPTLHGAILSGRTAAKEALEYLNERSK